MKQLFFVVLFMISPQTKAEKSKIYGTGKVPGIMWALFGQEPFTAVEYGGGNDVGEKALLDGGQSLTIIDRRMGEVALKEAKRRGLTIRGYLVAT